MADEWGYLEGCAFTPSRVIHKPHICSGTSCEAQVQQEVDNQTDRYHCQDSLNLGEVEVDEEETVDQAHNPKPRNDNENSGDKSILGFWIRGRECVFDVRITDTQTRTCRNQDPIRVLEKCEWEKKNKHLEACLERRKDFTPLV